MTLFIQDYETEDVLFSTTDAITAPAKGELILLNDKWYEVVDRNFSFKHLTVLDDTFVGCSYQSADLPAKIYHSANK